MLQVNHSGGLIDYYSYDGLGQRLAHWNNQLGSAKAERTYYDHQGRVRQQVSMGGDTTTYAYAWSGTLATSGMGAFGGWTQTTTYANGKTLTETSDAFGRALQKIDLGGHAANFNYDRAGRLIKRDSVVNGNVPAGDDADYSYLNTGRVSAASTTNTVASSSYGAPGTLVTVRMATYKYDAVGNLVAEGLAEKLTGYVGTYQSDTSTKVFESATASYDALGRLVNWAEAGSTETPAASTSYQYDANGNIRRSLASFHALDAQGGAASAVTTQDYWYRYDRYNRVVTQKGERSGSTIARGSNGIDILYNAAGERKTTLSSFADTHYEEVSDGDGGTYSIETPFTNTAEKYVYDDAGRLDKVYSADGTYWSQPGDPTALRANFDYDLMGRLTLQQDYDGLGTGSEHIMFSRAVSYNDKSQITSDISNTKTCATIYRAETTYSYGSGAGYALGSAISISTANFENNAAKKTTLTTNAYDWWDGVVQSGMSFDADTADANNTINTSTYTYANVGGQAQLTQVHIVDGRTRDVVFVNDSRRPGDSAERERQSLRRRSLRIFLPLRR